MRFFIIPLTVAPGASDSKVITGISGEVVKLGIYFPLNCGGALFVSLRFGDLYFPAPIEGGMNELTADDIFVPLLEGMSYVIGAEQEIILSGRNADPVYSHTAYLWVWVR